MFQPVEPVAELIKITLQPLTVVMYTSNPCLEHHNLPIHKRETFPFLLGSSFRFGYSAANGVESFQLSVLTAAAFSTLSSRNVPQFISSRIFNDLGIAAMNAVWVYLYGYHHQFLFL